MKSVVDLLKSAKKKRMLVVFPHPDDESVMSGGLIQRAASLNWEVKVICLTCGERGQNFGDAEMSLPELRASEFSLAIGYLGAEKTDLLIYCDGHLSEERSWEKPLRDIIKDFDPGIVVSYDDVGVTGHPDHIAVAKFLMRMKRYGAKWLMLAPFFERFPQWMIMNEKALKKGRANFELSLNWIETVRKLWAVRAHKSQKLLRNSHREIGFWWRCLRREDYVLV